MFDKDLFGLESERKIVKSGVRKIFTPHTPIQSIELFFGREAEVSKLIKYLNTPGQHAILYGERGVGKSSLANITCKLLIENLIDGSIFKKRCDSSDTFLTIVADPLKAVGIDISIKEKETASGKAIGGSFGISGEITDEQTSKMAGYSTSALSPSWVASKIQDIQGLLMIDEFDVIKNANDKRKIAELIKQLSDVNGSFKILVVGIAESAVELTAGHSSVQRCLKETRIGRMQDSELEKIITGGQHRLGITFSKEAIKRVVSVSSGYPHFTHLLALKAAEDAIT